MSVRLWNGIDGGLENKATNSMWEYWNSGGDTWVPGDRTGVHIPFENCLVGESHKLSLVLRGASSACLEVFFSVGIGQDLFGPDKRVAALVPASMNRTLRPTLAPVICITAIVV